MFCQELRLGTCLRAWRGGGTTPGRQAATRRRRPGPSWRTTPAGATRLQQLIALTFDSSPNIIVKLRNIQAARITSLYKLPNHPSVTKSQISKFPSSPYPNIRCNVHDLSIFLIQFKSLLIVHSVQTNILELLQFYKIRLNCAAQPSLKLSLGMPYFRAARKSNKQPNYKPKVRLWIDMTWLRRPPAWSASPGRWYSFLIEILIEASGWALIGTNCH